MNSNWKDKLTAYNGAAITYDAIGNPLTDGTWTYTWQNGRQLQQMSKSGTTASFVYNAEGLRVRKTVNGTVTNYILHGKNIVHMTQGSNTLHFLYAPRFPVGEARVSGSNPKDCAPSASLRSALLRRPEPPRYCAVQWHEVCLHS